MSERPPNFLLICTDQMRADHMGCDGNPVIKTPNLDIMAAEGVQFQRAYVNCPLCMPSRATLFTGLTPRGHRVRTNGIPLSPDIPTVPGALASAGYQTASVGKIHLSNFSLNSDADMGGYSSTDFPECIDYWKDGNIDSIPTPYYGLDDVEITLGHGSRAGGDYARWLKENHPTEAAKLEKVDGVRKSPLEAEACGTNPMPEECHHTTYVADRTIDRLRRAESGQPFFMICSFPDPHHPYEPPQPWDTMYGIDNVIPPAKRQGELKGLAPHFLEIYEGDRQLSGRIKSTKMSDVHIREILAHNYGMVSLIDKNVGRLLTALDETGLAEDTVVIFISDHGDLMGDHGLHNKGPFHFEGLLRVPMIWHWPGKISGGRVQSLSSLLDIPPTILELAGVEIPVGPSSPEALTDQPPAWPGRSLKPVLMDGADSVQESVVVENDEDYLGLRLRTLITSDHKITTYTGHRGKEPYGELFDLLHDPCELHNLWDSADHTGLRQDLIEQLHHRLTETDIAVPRRMAHA